MKRKTLVAISILLFSVCVTSAKKKVYPRADIKVGYTYHETLVRGSDGIVEKDIPFVLLANQSQAKFYCPILNIKILCNPLLQAEIKHAKYLMRHLKSIGRRRMKVL